MKVKYFETTGGFNELLGTKHPVMIIQAENNNQTPQKTIKRITRRCL